MQHFWFSKFTHVLITYTTEVIDFLRQVLYWWYFVSHCPHLPMQRWTDSHGRNDLKSESSQAELQDRVQLNLTQIPISSPWIKCENWKYSCQSFHFLTALSSLIFFVLLPIVIHTNIRNWLLFPPFHSSHSTSARVPNYPMSSPHLLHIQSFTNVVSSVMGEGMEGRGLKTRPIN